MAFRPTRLVKEGGSQKVYLQHLRHVVKENLGRKSWEAFMEDLHREVSVWGDMGDSIIIMGDFNKDMRSEYMGEWRDSLHLSEVLLDCLGEESAPSTFGNRTALIDSISYSTNIEVVKVGYLPFGDGAGHHKSLTIDIEEVSVFGVPGTPSSKLQARRLKLRDLRIVEKYLNIIRRHYDKNSLCPSGHAE